MSAPNDSYIYLHKVDGDANNNKFYEMKNLGNGTFEVTYGREGAAKPAKKVYPMNEWDSKYWEKANPNGKKGYTDVTAFRSVAKPTTSVKNSAGQVVATDPEVVNIINLLQSYAGQATKASYKVEAKSVTQAQVDAAQAQIDNLANSVKKYFGKTGWDINSFNKALTALMVIIPRKMKNVADHLMPVGVTKAQLDKLIADEQDLLDSMASQVTANAANDDTDDKSTIAQQKTLLESLGLEVRPATAEEIKEAKAQAKDHHRSIKRVFRVVNKETQKAFDKHMKGATNKTTKLLWHGSRRQNWWFIIQQGLRIRPSNAGYNGSAFGDGIYFASEDDKSKGYTDGGRWVGGGGGSAMSYMALYEVHVGKQYIIYNNSTLSSASTSRSLQVLKSNGDCDSTWARKKSDAPSGAVGGYYGLMRDEYITYKSEQSTIKYLIEFDF